MKTLSGRNTRVDVAIIGASLAGSALALNLQAQGVSCLLLDQADFPRRKACGEGLTALGIAELELLGLGDAVRSLPHVPFNKFNFFEHKKRSALNIFSDSSLHMHGIGVERYHLDNVLVEQAKRSDRINVLTNCAYDLHEAPNGGYTVETDSDSVTARILVFATGAQSKLANEFGLLNRINTDTRCGVSLCLRTSGVSDAVERAVAIYLNGDIQACCTPTASDKITVSIMTKHDKSRLLKRSRLALLVEEIKNELGIQGEIIDNVLGCAHIGKFERKANLKNLFTVGDARKQLDPIGGMGMTHALVNARVTSETISSFIKNPNQRKSPLARHDTAVRQATKNLSAYTALSYWSLISSSRLPLLNQLKSGRLAKDVMLTMHDATNFPQARALIPHVLLTSLGFFV